MKMAAWVCVGLVCAGCAKATGDAGTSVDATTSGDVASGDAAAADIPTPDVALTDGGVIDAPTVDVPVVDVHDAATLDSLMPGDSVADVPPDVPTCTLLCGEHGHCASPTSPVCTCDAGWTPAGKGSPCVDVDECKPTSPCPANSTCTNTPGGHTCACAFGYADVGGTCTKIDECSPNPCLNGGSCAGSLGTFVCFCKGGYEGPLCATDADPCSPNPCTNGGACKTLSKTEFACDCATGFSGKTCAETSKTCTTAATCDDGDACSLDVCVGGTCKDGTKFQNSCYVAVSEHLTWEAAEADCVGRGGHLATISSESENDAVRAIATKTCGPIGAWIGLNDVATEGTFVWVSGEPVTYTHWNKGEPNNSGGTEDWTDLNADGRWNDGNTGDVNHHCHVCEIAATPTPTGVCQSYHQTCNDQDGCTTDACTAGVCSNTTLSCDDGSVCTTDSCDDGCANDAIDCNDHNTCTVDACDPKTGCTHAPLDCDDGTDCSVDGCKFGSCTHTLAPGVLASVCPDSNDCKADSCQNGGKCVDAYHSVSCTCVGDWTGTLCELDATPCDPNPCQNAGTCSVSDSGTASCDCPDGWVGQFCEKVD